MTDLSPFRLDFIEIESYEASLLIQGNIGYYKGYDSSLPTGSSVLVGYSNFALSVMIVISIAIICVPILVGLEQSSPNMIHPGSNSLSISAAVSRPSHFLV